MPGEWDFQNEKQNTLWYIPISPKMYNLLYTLGDTGHCPDPSMKWALQPWSLGKESPEYKEQKPTVWLVGKN